VYALKRFEADRGGRFVLGTNSFEERAMPVQPGFLSVKVKKSQPAAGNTGTAIPTAYGIGFAQTIRSWILFVQNCPDTVDIRAFFWRTTIS